MAELLPSREQENSMWAKLEQQRNMRQAAAARVTPQSYQALTGLQKSYPQLATGTKVSLAAAGVNPNDPIMASVVQADQRVKKKKGFGFHSIGDVVSAGLHNTIGKGFELAGDVVSPIGGAVGSVIRPTVRTGLMALSAPFEEAGGLLRNVASGLPGKAGEITAGALGGAATGAGLAATLTGVGAAVGSVVPGLGTVIGGAVGAGAAALVGGAAGAIAGALGPDVEGAPVMGSQSQLGIAAGHLLKGQKVEAGSGFLPNAETGLGQEQKARALSAAGIKNKKGEVVQGWTIGRSVADVIAEPGTTPYNLLSGMIDASAAIKLDPSAHALKHVEFDRTLAALKKDGMIDAARKTILPEKVTDLLDHSEFGAKLKDAVAGEGNTYRISKLFNGQLDHNPAALSALADADTPEAAAAILKPLLGGDVANIPKTEIAKRRVTRLLPNFAEDKALTARQLVEVPGRLEWDDTAGAIKQIDAWQAIAKVPEADRLANNDEFIRALSGPATGRLPALEAVAKSVSSAAKAHGADEVAARKLGTLFAGSIEDARLFTAGTITDNALLPGMVIGGDGVGLKSPFMINEFLNHGVTLPDPRELSRSVRLVKAFNHPLAQVPIELADKAMYRWRQMAVLRPATTLRVAADEQARLATANYNGLFNHPFQFIARAVVEKRGNVMPDLTGIPLLDSEITKGALNRTRGSEALKNAGVSMADRVRLSPNDGADIFKAGWRDHELNRLHTDPISRQLARFRRTGNTAAEFDEIPEAAAAFDSFDDPIRTATIDATGRGPNYQSVDDLKQSFWDGPLAKHRTDLQAMDESVPVLATRAESDAYIDQINTWIDDFTRNDDRLLEYVHRGPRTGTQARSMEAMDELLAAGNHPPLVVGDRTIRGGADRKQILDRATDALFDTFHSRPTNFFARSKVLGEDYWRNVERMMPGMDDGAKAWAIKVAEDAKLDPEAIKRLRARAAVPWEGERLAKDQVDFIAKVQATENTKKLLYDVSTKGKWADASRLIFPFAEPWKESLTIWSKLLTDNPSAVRRLDQTIQGARGSGFFQKDPQTGEEMFTYPGSAFISKMLVGAPVPLKGSASGLNLFASNPVMPGMGPVMQVAANQLLPDKPDFDWIRETVSPYGRTDTSGGFVESFLPAWTQKIRQALTSGESDRLFNNTVYDMARYLVSTGEYSIETPEAQEQTTAAATSMAKRMYLLRAGASFVSPSAPSPEMVAEDKDGRVVTQFKLMDEYRNLQTDPEEGKGGVGYEQATQEFITRYGEDALLFMQPKTKGGAAPLEDTMDWIRENPGLAKRYDSVYQYFAPHSGEFSQTAYERELANGERKALTPQEAMEGANSRVASMLMRQARTKTGKKISDSERKWLSDVQAALVDEYPGYNPQSFDAGKVPAAIRQLEDALGEPKMAETKNGQAIALYLQARDKAQAKAEAQGLTGFGKAKKARGTRDWLRAVAAALTEETPEFATIWEQLLSHELASDIEETTSV